MPYLVILVIVLLYLLVLLAEKNKKLKIQNDDYYFRFEPIINIEKELKKITKETENLKSEYKAKKEIFDELSKKIEIYSDDLEMYEVGIYKPKFNLDTSTKYKIKLSENIEEQKTMIRNKKAVVCSANWTVDGSKTEGKKMTDRQIKLTLKAFNGQCDTLIKNVSWNNVRKIEERINKAFIDINKLNEPNKISIHAAYLLLKMDELKLTYEYEQKKYEEKEEQKRIKEMMREEEKIQRDIECKQKEIEKQEREEAELNRKLQEAYEKGQKEIAEMYQKEIDTLKQTIEDSKRAISQAQMTKVGHVYVISNIGSFGENVYKIGMTRRLEPQERVDELGDASVPFKFDVHAMIKSDNAPELENKLHDLFKKKSVNKINYRKEFFNVSLDEIEKAVKEYTNSEIEFTKVAEAREYRETLAINKAENREPAEVKEVFPSEI